jgi:hypothetical protein
MYQLLINYKPETVFNQPHSWLGEIGAMLLALALGFDQLPTLEILSRTLSFGSSQVENAM